VIDPLGNVTQNVFDKAGRPTGVTDRNGNFIRYTYDNVGRLIRKTYPDNTGVSYLYDALGRIKRATNQHTTLTFTYDVYGNITSAHDGRLDKTITYAYDLAGRRMSMTAEGKTTTYEYDNSSNLKSITASGKVFSFGYDQLGRRASLAYPNGIVANYVYDSASELLNLNNKFQSNEITKNMYEYDLVGNRINNTDLKGTHSYQYDSLYQLIEATHPNSSLEAFTYDKTGNRVQEMKGEAIVNYTTGTGNRINTRNGESYELDRNGNLSSKINGNGTTIYQYDYENRLIKAILPNGTVAEYKYDPFGRRIEKNVNGTVTKYLYDNEDILAEYDGNNYLKAEYVHGVGIDEPLAIMRTGQNYYNHTDGLGSVSVITNASGSVVQKYEYDSFGEITYVLNPEFMQPYTYTAREYDWEINLYHYRAKTYDWQTGRFTSEDPIGFEAGDTNVFRFVGNNPVNRIDPLGLDYLDLNLSLGIRWGLGITGGIMIDECGVHPYLGGGLITPGFGVALTRSPSHPSQGWNVGLQPGYGVAGQVGYSFEKGGSWFYEYGIGTPGASLTGYYVWGPFSKPEKDCNKNCKKSR